MSIKKSLLALAAAALASMAFVSSALAFGGTVKDVNTGLPMAIGEKVHYEGWAKFDAGALGNYECHVTAETKAVADANGNGDTKAEVTKFTVPDTTKCTGKGTLEKCKLIGHELEKEPLSFVTARETDFDLLETKLKLTFAECIVTNITLTFQNHAVTLRPLATGATEPTGTTGKFLGGTAVNGQPIAGVEISGKGKAKYELHQIFIPTTQEPEVTVSGELEVTNGTPAGNDRCTWELVKV